jgi:hypothetical protein
MGTGKSGHQITRRIEGDKTKDKRNTRALLKPPRVEDEMTFSLYTNSTRWRFSMGLRRPLRTAKAFEDFPYSTHLSNK